MTLYATTTEATVILWHGQYHADGLERLAIVKNYHSALFGLRNPRLVGTPGRWKLVAEAATMLGVE